jgi:hypothetical protein
MERANSEAFCSTSRPVEPFTTVSRGPPVATATTGQPDFMASSGTIPKCSLVGVYL